MAVLGKIDMNTLFTNMAKTRAVSSLPCCYLTMLEHDWHRAKCHWSESTRYSNMKSSQLLTLDEVHMMKSQVHFSVSFS